MSTDEPQTDDVGQDAEFVDDATDDDEVSPRNSSCSTAGSSASWDSRSTSPRDSPMSERRQAVGG
jgi:hypothetical protein